MNEDSVTTELELGTGIVILPQRNPLVLAKQVASLDVLCGGRLRLGVGAGYLEPELAALGVPMSERGSRTDEDRRRCPPLRRPGRRPVARVPAAAGGSARRRVVPGAPRRLGRVGECLSCGGCVPVMPRRSWPSSWRTARTSRP
ncbi:LLM class flavin-dependent oxidoreductase [Dactylosporangium sp. NBC_01737]|uniref:LLM class flavin-dependent oxidoreductase n=1 Tax=Dactylosporangium sp. NBC_01737 TaxID=2975959 RepID=UPI003FA3A250